MSDYPQHNRPPLQSPAKKRGTAENLPGNPGKRSRAGRDPHRRGRGEAAVPSLLSLAGGDGGSAPHFLFVLPKRLRPQAWIGGQPPRSGGAWAGDKRAAAGPRRRKFHIPRFAASGKTPSFHCVSSPHGKRSAGFPQGPQSGRFFPVEQRQYSSIQPRIFLLCAAFPERSLPLAPRVPLRYALLRRGMGKQKPGSPFPHGADKICCLTGQGKNLSPRTAAV